MLTFTYNKKCKLNLFSDMISHQSNWQTTKILTTYSMVGQGDSGTFILLVGMQNKTTQGKWMSSKITYLIILISAISLLGTFSKIH